MKQTFFRAAAAALGVLVSAMAGRAFAQSPPPPPGAVPVSVAAVTRRDVPVLLRNLGNVQALNTVLVRARVDGTLDRVAFTEGQDVRAGDLLAQIDPRPYAAVYAQAVAKRASDQAQMDNARRDLSRYQNLARSDFASRQQVDTQSASVNQLQATIQGDEAAIAQAKLNLDYASITSPIDGRVGLRQVDPGNLIHATDTQGIVTVTQIRPISVVFTLPQETLPQVQAAMARGKLPVFAYASDDKTGLGQGELLTIDNQVDQGTGTFRLKATFANQQQHLWPGQFVNVRLQTDTLPGALVIPSPAVQRGPNGLFVYVVRPDQVAHMQPVEIRQDDGSQAVVTKGLGEGEHVVTNGQSRLQDGVKVAVQPEKAAS